MKTQVLRFTLGCVLLGAAGCAELDGKPDVSDVKGGVDGKAEAWGPSDSPAMFSNSLEYRIAELPMTGQATNIPWAGNYWPVYEDSINHKWAGASSQSASAKYGAAFGVTGVEDAVSRYHGIDAQTSRTACTTDSQCNAQIGERCSKREGQTNGRCIPTWWGICHAWAPASILLPEPKRAVTYNGVEFKVQDIKALVTLVHDRTETKFVSLRCDTDAEGTPGVNYDNYGRPTGGDASCRDTNAGTYHVLITNYLGKQGTSFVEDRTFDDEVWNQPLRGYRITSQVEVSALEANKLIGVPPTGGTLTEKSGSVAKGQWAHQAPVAVSAGTTLSVQMTGTGDGDLYVRFGSQPTQSAKDCSSTGNESTEACTVTVPAGATQAFVSVYGYSETAATFNLKITAGGQVPTSYVFNDKAAKLYKVHTDVDYISESSSSTDGNLGSTIDRYTHTDRYDYILEVDADGKIIGGEWLGDSKRNHPDFVWMALRSRSTTVAGGKITYANVKAIYDLSMQDGTPPTTGGVKTITEAFAVTKAQWKHYGPYNVAAGATLTAVMTGDNDADLYVRKDAAPTAASYDCRPYRDGSAEECAIVGPAKVYVGVNGYAASSAVDLTITYTEGTGTVTPPPPPATVTHLNETGAVTRGELKVFSMDVIAGKKLFIRTTAPSDVDLYLQMGAAPTTAAYAARAYTSSGNETITYTPTSSGKLFIAVHGYAASNFTLRTAEQ
ncbi:MAG: pre-peptidase C-terminal domain-containing protein [Kofleriaceae bacterium]|nr:pre-peptidase C-terminal domain-containing protein [Kofleriaceae bacterium]MBP9171290.1 pre-peptidase C-terminal domain-containing protein [Kofleriaceae bacterium]MBP9861566.1 pre-peptidase C-terminal domain-containing protein [Kofleriaceae bacterium]